MINIFIKQLNLYIILLDLILPYRTLNYCHTYPYTNAGKKYSIAFPLPRNKSKANRPIKENRTTHQTGLRKRVLMRLIFS